MCIVPTASESEDSCYKHHPEIQRIKLSFSDSGRRVRKITLSPSSTNTLHWLQVFFVTKSRLVNTISQLVSMTVAIMRTGFNLYPLRKRKRPSLSFHSPSQSPLLAENWDQLLSLPVLLPLQSLNFHSITRLIFWCTELHVKSFAKSYALFTFYFTSAFVTRTLKQPSSLKSHVIILVVTYRIEVCN